MLEQSTKDGLSDFSPESVLLGKELFAVFETALKAMPRMRRRIFLLVRGAIATLDICACNTELPTQHILFKLATADFTRRSEEHTSELQSLMRISYAVFCLKKKNKTI